jgi:hypothetical protein
MIDFNHNLQIKQKAVDLLEKSFPNCTCPTEAFVEYIEPMLIESFYINPELCLTSLSALVHYLISLEVRRDVRIKFGLDQSIDFVTVMVQVFALYVQGNSKFKYLFEFDSPDELNQAVINIKLTI